MAIASLSIAWLCANGAIWDAMQVVAWGKMFAGYTATMSITAALRETFDPAKPCDMCLGVAKAKHETSKELPPAGERAVAKFILAMNPPDNPVFWNNPGDWPRVVTALSMDRTDPVPLPPPRA
ncbi:MAG: hypothetical protein ACREIA_11620 [Opitutaceae bacterium]